MFAAKEREGNKVSLVFSITGCTDTVSLRQGSAQKDCQVFISMYHKTVVHVLCILGILMYVVGDTFEM